MLLLLVLLFKNWEDKVNDANHGLICRGHYIFCEMAWQRRAYYGNEPASHGWIHCIYYPDNLIFYYRYPPNNAKKDQGAGSNIQEDKLFFFKTGQRRAAFIFEFILSVFFVWLWKNLHHMLEMQWLRLCRIGISLRHGSLKPIMYLVKCMNSLRRKSLDRVM